MSRDNLYTQQAYSVKKGVTERTVRNWIKEGRVKTVWVGGYKHVKGRKMVVEKAK